VHGSRPARLGDQIREELAAIIAREVKDPGIGFLTLTHVKVSADLQVARVYYTALGDLRARRETARALDRATPFLRRQIAGRLRLRRAPEIHFQYDESIARAERVEQLLRDIHAAAAQSETDPSGESRPDPDDSPGADRER
jgi:ribosome-binding factor A